MGVASLGVLLNSRPRRVRKELKIRPGFTPQEDVSRFRGTRQKQMDTTALPKGHILGWIAPSSASPPKPKAGASAPPPNKNAKRRANRKAKKAEEPVKDNWEDEDEGEGAAPTSADDKAKDVDLAQELSKLNVK